MPSQPPTPPGHRPSQSGTKLAIKAISDLNPLQKKVFFSIGAILAGLVLLRFLVVDIVRAHDHGSALVAAGEVGGSIALLVLAIAFMVPPFGMWMISHIPLPGFLKRKAQ